MDLALERGQTVDRITIMIDSKDLEDILRKHVESAFPSMKFESCDMSSYSLTEILVHLRRKDETLAGPRERVIP